MYSNIVVDLFNNNVGLVLVKNYVDFLVVEFHSFYFCISEFDWARLGWWVRESFFYFRHKFENSNTFLLIHLVYQLMYFILQNILIYLVGSSFLQI